MMTDEMKSGTPLLAGWAIASAAGLVAFGVSMVVVGLGLTQAAFIGAVIFAVVGLILGLAHGDVGGPVAAAPVAADRVAPAPVAPAPMSSCQAPRSRSRCRS